jgi:hypothetical protein
MSRLACPVCPRIVASRAAGATLLACAVLAAGALPAQGRPPVSFTSEDPVPVTGSLAPAATGAAAPFARVRYQEGDVEVRQGSEMPRPVDVNYPLFAGERIDTDSGQRAELQLPDGTLLRIDRDSAVAFDDFGARDGGTSVVAISQGQVQLVIGNARGGDSLRVDTPSASIYPLDASVVRVDVDPGDMVRVSVASGRVEVAAESGSVVLVSGERTAVAPGSAPRDPWRYAAGARDNFDAWAAQRDREDPAAVAMSEVGVEYEALPEEVQPYYGELSEAGNWVYTEDYGWAFQPNVGSDWQPYQDGQWYPSPAGDPVWVGAEPWGWATWRYGSWNFNVGFGGWVWVPGATWGPANVWWYYGPSYVGWVPAGYWGWPVYGWYGAGYWGSPWFDYCPWTFMGYDDFWYNPVPRAAVSRDRILNPELDRGVVSREAIPAPDGRRARAADKSGREARETLDRGVYDRARKRAERGDRDVRPVPRGTVEDEMRRERGAGTPGQRTGSGQGAVPSGRREAIGRGGEGSPETVKPPAAVPPRRGSGVGSGKAVVPRSPSTPAPSRPATPRAPRRTVPDGSGERQPGVAPRTPGSGRAPQPGGGTVAPGTPRSPRTFPRAPEGSVAPRNDESVRRFFGRLSEDTRLAPRAPRPSPLRPGSGPSRPDSAAPAPRAPRPQAGSPSAPRSGPVPRAPSAGSRGGSGSSGKPPAAAPRSGSGGSPSRSAPAPRSGGGGAPSGGSGGRGSGGGGHSASPRR